LAWWISEPDNGMYQAIQKGFDHSTGEIMAWLNSDDKYILGALSVVEEIFSTFSEIEWLTSSSGITWDKLGRAVNVDNRHGFNRNSFFRGSNLTGQNWHSTYFIQQETTFWKRSLWEKAGGQLDISLKLAGDFALWAEFFCHANLYTVCTSFGGMRSHESQKSVNYFPEYINEAKEVLYRYKGQPYGKFESIIRHFFYQLIGRSFIPRHHLSKFVIMIFDVSHLFYKTKRCYWYRDGWKIVDGYIL